MAGESTFAPSFNTLQFSSPAVKVVTVHDVTPVVMPSFTPMNIIRKLQFALRRAVTGSDGIIAISERSNPGVDATFQPVRNKARIGAVLSRYRIDEEYILYAGIYRRHKNHAGFMRAFREFLRDGGKAKLVIAGSIDEGSHERRRLASGTANRRKNDLVGVCPRLRSAGALFGRSCVRLAFFV